MRHFCNKQSDNPNSLACRALGKATNPQASWKPMRYYPNTPFCFKQRSPFARTYLRVVSFFGQTGALLGAKLAKLPRSGKPTAFKLGSLQRPHGRLGPIAFSFPSGRPGHPTETGRLFGCQAWAFAPVIRADAQARPFTVDYKRRTALRARVASPPLPLSLLPFPSPPLPLSSSLTPIASVLTQTGSRSASRKELQPTGKLEPSSNRRFHWRAQDRAPN